jgi:hypothetical protein
MMTVRRLSIQWMRSSLAAVFVVFIEFVLCCRLLQGEASHFPVDRSVSNCGSGVWINGTRHLTGHKKGCSVVVNTLTGWLPIAYGQL